jgi:hypothetical protein
MMKRNKLILIILLVVAVLACGAVGWLLIQSIISKTAAYNQRNDDYAKVKKIYRAKVFPNPENIDRVKEQQKELEAWLASVGEQLHKGDLPDENLTPATFKQNLQKTVRSLSRQPGIRNGSVVKQDFHFGFDQYLGESNQLPKREDVARLTTQLGMIETISRELYSAKILSLDAIKRDAFDDAAVVTEEEPNRDDRRRRNRPPSNSGQKVEQPQSVAKQVHIPDGLVEKESFTFEFTATAESYVAALNKLSSMDMFVVIVESTFAKTGDQLKKLDEKPKSGIEDAVDKKKLSDMSHAERAVTNPSQDHPVSARLVIDVYTFKGV